jgi:ABC-type uncharacterized transport system substrate-binding protein
MSFFHSRAFAQLPLPLVGLVTILALVNAGLSDQKNRVIGLESKRAKQLVYIDFDVKGAEEEYEKFVVQFQAQGLHDTSITFLKAESADVADRILRMVQAIKVVKPDLILVTNDIDAIEIRSAFPNTPLLFLANSDPLRAGLVTNIGASQTNATGISFYQPIEGKQLELLQQCVPSIRSVGILVDPIVEKAIGADAYTKGGKQLNLNTKVVKLELNATREELMAALAVTNADAWLFPVGFISMKFRSDLTDHVRINKIPSMFGRRQGVQLGGLMSYEDSLIDWHEPLAKQASLILQGMPPTMIPVERPRTFDLSLNLDMAQQINNLNKACLFQANIHISKTKNSS